MLTNTVRNRAVSVFIGAVLILFSSAVLAQVHDLSTACLWASGVYPSSCNNSFTVSLLQSNPAAEDMGWTFKDCVVTGQPADGAINVGLCRWTQFADGGYNLTYLRFNWEKAGDSNPSGVFGQFNLLNEIGQGNWVRFYTPDGVQVEGSASGSLASVTIMPIAQPTPKPTPPPRSSTLGALLGTWEFEYTIISTFYDHYLLDHIDVKTETPVIVGTDLDQGDMIIAARTADLVSDPFPYDFALLDPGIITCDFFIFDHTSANVVEGAEILTWASSTNLCGGFVSGHLWSMTGFRTSPSRSSGLRDPFLLHPLESLVLEESEELQRQDDDTSGVHQETLRNLGIDPDVLDDLLSALQHSGAEASDSR